MAVYLGFDSSTQGLTAIAIEVASDRRRVLFERVLRYDDALPSYGTTNGVWVHDDPRLVTSSPLMWTEALDRMMEGIATEYTDLLSDIRAISGAAQQHGSVYLNASAGTVLATLDHRRPLVGQLEGTLARADAPVWMDSSTGSQCRAITDALGGDEAIIRLTGSRAHERFTGPQIRKFAEEHPDGYARTDRIHLVSSYLASLLAGSHAPIDPGDGAGMNLMDITRREWSPDALHATAPSLGAKLPPIVVPWTVVGPLATYWQQRYGFPSAHVVVWTGDNPSSLIGVGIVEEGQVAVSLGTSDTVFGVMHDAAIDLSGTAHTFGSPTGKYMSLVCFRNGSLVREHVRDDYGLDWSGFSRILQDTTPGNHGVVMLPWLDPEITPPVATPGLRRFGLERDDVQANVRAIVEGQMMAMALHSRWTQTRVDRIHATGGAARNTEILQVMADVFGASVQRVGAGSSAALGAALRAFHADARRTGHPLAWTDIVSGFVSPTGAVLEPDRDHHERYTGLMGVYEACEEHVLRGGPEPSSRIADFRERFA
jgi:xylulokinase